MKKGISFLVLLSSVLILFSCKTSGKAVKDPDNMNTAGKPQIKKVITQEGYQLPEGMAAVTIDSVSLKGDLLTMIVSYSGGCKDHEFDLYFQGLWMKSMPPKVNLFLYHNAHDDSCREWKTSTLVFDISPVRMPTKEHAEVHLKVMGTEEFLKYVY